MPFELTIKISYTLTQSLPLPVLIRNSFRWSFIARGSWYWFALGNVSVDTYGGDGTWRSLVARTLGVGEVPSSNLGVPTKNRRQAAAAGGS